MRRRGRLANGLARPGVTGLVCLLLALAGPGLGCGKYGPPIRADGAVAGPLEPEEPSVEGPVDPIVNPGESDDDLPATLGEPVPLDPQPTGRPTGLP